MKLQIFDEPELQFGEGYHICPRAGISRYKVYDTVRKTRKEHINIGLIGNREGVDKLHRWIDKCSGEIAAKDKTKQPNLFPTFTGFNKYSGGFRAELIHDSELERVLPTRELDKVLKISAWDRRVEECALLFYEQIKFLSQNRNVDVIACVVPEDAFTLLTKEENPQVDETLEEQADDLLEVNFRRLLKAKALHLHKPLQLVRETTLSKGSGQQDEATKAWNFCTAIYYKANRTTVPWRLIKEKNKPRTCYVGIGFYRSRDKKEIHTSIAQVFDEQGNGVILRGEPVQLDKRDRRPYLTTEQANALLTDALYEYKIALSHAPARLVIHKSSLFRETEQEGFYSSAEEKGIGWVDMVTILDSNMRLLREGQYPSRRGTYLELDRNNALLYTRGSVEHYRTYPGMYIPQPLSIRTYNPDTSVESLSKEILSLTKMNWNNTQFDGKYPITIQCARKVGEIMKYLGEYEKAEPNYSFYM